MIILGIDPGFARTGYGVIEVKNNVCFYKTHGVITTETSANHSERLAQLKNKLEKIIKKHSPDAAAIEEIFMCKNVKTAIKVGEAYGVILLTVWRFRIAIMEFTPLQVKQSLTGYGRAEKAQMQKMVKLVLGMRDIPQPDDAADGLAIALCAANQKVYLKKF